MAEQVVHRALGIVWPAAIVAAVVAFLVTVVIPPAGFLAGPVALVVLGIGIARRRTNVAIAIAAGVAAAVLCYLGIWLIGSIIDPGTPASGSGSSAAQIP
jgi:hypothetical protein